MTFKVKSKKKNVIFEKTFGVSPKKSVHATTFDGKNKVIVNYPVKPNSKIKKEVSTFLLHELDDHKALDRFMKKEKISQRQLEGYYDL